MLEEVVEAEVLEDQDLQGNTEVDEDLRITQTISTQMEFPNNGKSVPRHT